MQHFIYSMQGDDTPPAGGGTTAGWFYYYKWNVDGETYLPVPAPFVDAITQEFGGVPAVGDVLWFVMDGSILGYVPVLRTLVDELNDRLEIYYDTRQLHEVTSSVTAAATSAYRRVASQTLDEFVLSCQAPPRGAAGNKESKDATRPCPLPENVAKTLVQGLAVNCQ